MTLEISRILWQDKLKEEKPQRGIPYHFSQWTVFTHEVTGQKKMKRGNMY